METWYQWKWGSLELREVQVIRETTHQIIYYDERWQKERRVFKDRGNPFFKNKQKAISYKKNKLVGTVYSLEDKLKSAQEGLDAFLEKYDHS